MERDDEPTQLRYAQALADWGDAGGYEAEVVWDVCCTDGARHSLRRGPSGARCARCPAASRSGSCWRRCCAAPTRCCCSTSRTTTSTCPASAGWRRRCASRRRPSCTSATTASCWPARRTRIVTRRGRHRLDARRRVRDLPRGPAGPARAARGAAPPLGRGARRLKDLVRSCSTGGEHRRTWPAATTRADPAAQVRGGRAAPGAAQASRTSRCGCAGPYRRRAVTCEGLELTGLIKPFDLEVFYGERVAVLGRTARASRTSCGCCAGEPVAHTGRSWTARRTGSSRRVDVRPDPRAPRAGRPDRCSTSCGSTSAATRGPAMARLRRYELDQQAEQRFDTLSGGQQARFQILLLELAGSTLLLLDEPTDNLDLVSAEALEDGLEAYEGTVAGRDPRPLVRPRRSTASSSSARTAGSTRRPSRYGTRVGSCAPADLAPAGAGGGRRGAGAGVGF